MAEETYYELLQVTAAYRALIRRHHPDRNPSPIAVTTTQRLNEAWEVLSDPARRAEYDRERRGRTSSSSGGTGQTSSRTYQSSPNPPPPPRPPPRPPSSPRRPPPNPYLRYIYDLPRAFISFVVGAAMVGVLVVVTLILGVLFDW